MSEECWYHLKDEGHGATDADRLVEAQLQVLWRGTEAEKIIREPSRKAQLATRPFIIGRYRSCEPLGCHTLIRNL